jgi:hypothetical protein
VPARFFAWLGGLVFVVGWLVGAYAAFADDSGPGSFGQLALSYRLNVLVGTGIQATIAAAVLWGVAAFLWVKVLPALPEGPGAPDDASSPPFQSP